MTNDDKNIDWKKLWIYLSVDTTKPGYCDAQGWVTESELRALDKFADFLKKMNPPENDRIPEPARKENDVKFRTFMQDQFKKYQHVKRIEP